MPPGPSVSCAILHIEDVPRRCSEKEESGHGIFDYLCGIRRTHRGDGCLVHALFAPWHPAAPDGSGAVNPPLTCIHAAEITVSTNTPIGAAHGRPYTTSHPSTHTRSTKAYAFGAPSIHPTVSEDSAAATIGIGALVQAIADPCHGLALGAGSLRSQGRSPA